MQNIIFPKSNKSYGVRFKTLHPSGESKSTDHLSENGQLLIGKLQNEIITVHVKSFFNG